MDIPISSYDDENRFWRIYADTVEIAPSILKVVSTRGECLMVGAAPNGRHSIMYREPGGGGVVTLPWARDQKGRVLVGLVNETRSNLGPAPQLCAMGGFIRPGEDRGDAQARESLDEGGLSTKSAVAFRGVPLVQDRAIAVANAAEDEGIRCYGLELPFGSLQARIDESYILAPGALADTAKESVLLFLHWKRACFSSPDALALALILRLIAHLDPA